MTDATTNGPVSAPAKSEKATTRPAPKRRGGPVFIGDILTTTGGRPTLLVKWDEDADGSDQSE